MPTPYPTPESTGLPVGDPTGLHRVLEPPGVLPQAALRLDTRGRQADGRRQNDRQPPNGAREHAVLPS